MRVFFNHFLAFVLCFFLMGSLFSALLAEQTGEIRGTITEEKGEVLPGVTVTARSPNLQGLRTAVSDKNGFYRLPLLPIGIYSLTFELPGFEKLTPGMRPLRRFKFKRGKKEVRIPEIMRSRLKDYGV